MKDFLAQYQNGNYAVRLFADGTKEKETAADVFQAAFPDSVDLKITDYCDRNCAFCHENSSTSGRHGDLFAPFLSSLPRGIELAIGGGNPLSHPGLIPFLERMKNRGIICNLTVNGSHLKNSMAPVQKMLDDGLIHGLGISIVRADDELTSFAARNENAVFHVINGLFGDYARLMDKNLKILLLGYKHFGRGKEHFSQTVSENMVLTKQILPKLFGHFRVISFDNAALLQLDVAEIVGEERLKQVYMGNDGEASMYIDLVKNEYALSSTDKRRYPIGNDLRIMFSAFCRSTE